MSESRYALIVAGGSGTRMGSKIPKQFLEMKGRPLLMHTIEAFHKHSADTQIVVVLPEAHLSFWEELCDRYQFKVPLTLQAGGDTRFQSVQNGLRKVSGPGLVAIHDGVRPVVSSKIIEDSFQVAGKHGSAIAAVELKDSIRKIENSSSRVRDRSTYKLVQTPQTFDIYKLAKAYGQPEQKGFTDDASVWEAAGQEVTLFEGSYENLKITTFHDLVVAEVLLKFI